MAHAWALSSHLNYQIMDNSDPIYRDLVRSAEASCNNDEVEVLLLEKKKELKGDEKEYAIWLGRFFYRLTHPTTTCDLDIEKRRLKFAKEKILPALFPLLFDENGSLRKERVYVDDRNGERLQKSIREGSRLNLFTSIIKKYNLLSELYPKTSLEEIIFGDMFNKHRYAGNMLKEVLTFHAQQGRSVMIEAVNNSSNQSSGSNAVSAIFSSIRRVFRDDRAGMLDLVTQILSYKTETNKSVAASLFNARNFFNRDSKRHSIQELFEQEIAQFGPHDINSPLAEALISTIPKKVSENVFVDFLKSSGIQGAKKDFFEKWSKSSSTSSDIIPSTEVRASRFVVDEAAMRLLGHTSQPKRRSENKDEGRGTRHHR